MSYLSLYRKYRSQTFSDLIGQDHVVRTLQNAVASGKIAHSYLFTGPRGTGKTSSARLLAKCLNCEKGPTPEPCNQCEQCLSITQGNCIDVYELDAASESGVDNVRETIVDASQYAPSFCRYKIFIIDEVHDLSNKAFDALLKTVEEPPPYIIFILATTEYNKVPPTIRSRCQKYEFHRASMQNLVERLSYVITSEGAEAEPAALTAMARMADGGYRDALTLLEQALLTGEGKITLDHVYDQLGLVSEEAVDKLLLGMRRANVSQIIDTLGEISRRGRDPRSVLESMMYRLSDLTRAAYTVDVGASTDSTREAALHETASHLGRENLLWLRGAIAQTHRAIREVTLPRIWLEAELIRIATTTPLAPLKVQPEAKQAVVRGEAAPKPVEPKRAQPKEAIHEPDEMKPAAVQLDAEPALASNGSADAPAAVWSNAVASLPATTAIAMKLTDSKLIEFGDGVLTVEIRNVHLAWFTEKSQRQQHINKVVQTTSGKDWVVRFVPKSEGGKKAPAPAEAVELPLEGDPLYKAAANTFKSE